MKQPISDEEREQRVREHMKFANVTEAEARFMVAKELGEIPGDVIEVDGDETNDEEPQ